MAYSLGGVALAALCAAVPLGAARAEVVVTAGRSVSLMTLASIDQACHAQGPVTITVIEPPRGGYIQTSQTKDYPNFNTLNGRARCNTLKLPATRVTYQSAGNFLGLDFVTVEAVYPEGGVKRIRLAISVRPVAPPAPGALPERVDVPEGPLAGPEPSSPAAGPKPKPRVRHAGVRPHPAGQPGCKTPCVLPGKAPTHPESHPAEAKAVLTPI